MAGKDKKRTEHKMKQQNNNKGHEESMAMNTIRGLVDIEGCPRISGIKAAREKKCKEHKL